MHHLEVDFDLSQVEEYWRSKIIYIPQEGKNNVGFQGKEERTEKCRTIHRSKYTCQAWFSGLPHSAGRLASLLPDDPGGWWGTCPHFFLGVWLFYWCSLHHSVKMEDLRCRDKKEILISNSKYTHGSFLLMDLGGSSSVFANNQISEGIIFLKKKGDIKNK